MFYLGLAMICNDIEDAARAVDKARNEGLRGLYPSAAIVLSDYADMLLSALHVIAYPRRGTPEECWTVEEIATFASKFVSLEYERGNSDPRCFRCEARIPEQDKCWLAKNGSCQHITT